MSTHTETITVTCPRIIHSRAVMSGTDGSIQYESHEQECGAEIEVDVGFGWDPGQDGGHTDPSWPAHVEDVEVPVITCEHCGHDFTEAEREAIAKAFEPTHERGYYEYDGPDTVNEWDDPPFNWDINGRCAP
jgi:hypothetical protein